jgi:hypothetical protein
MTSFFWSSGHIGWPLFGIVVLSVLCLLATDITWRTVRIRIPTLLPIAAAVWVVGAAVIIAIWYV